MSSLAHILLEWCHQHTLWPIRKAACPIWVGIIFMWIGNRCVHCLRCLSKKMASPDMNPLTLKAPTCWPSCLRLNSSGDFSHQTGLESQQAQWHHSFSRSLSISSSSERALSSCPILPKTTGFLSLSSVRYRPNKTEVHFLVGLNKGGACAEVKPWLGH